VPHHGSRTSSTPEFVAAVAADYAVIPVGRRSPYGHPHPEVVGRWLNAGARLLTTGERGAIKFTTDGYFLDVEQFMP
jgi:competence protein ComEC